MKRLSRAKHCLYDGRIVSASSIPLCWSQWAASRGRDVLQFMDAFEIVLAGSADEGQRHGTERHVEESASFRRDDVIFALGNGGRDNLDLALVEADPLVEFARPALARSAVGQTDLRRAGFLQHVDDAGSLSVGDRLRGQHHGAVCLAQNFQPFPDLVAEHGMSEHQPGLIEDDEAGRSSEALFDAAEQIGEHRHEIAVAHVHELLDLECLERAKRQTIGFGIEQLPHRSIDRVVVESVLDLAHLHA